MSAKCGYCRGETPSPCTCDGWVVVCYCPCRCNCEQQTTKDGPWHCSDCLAGNHEIPPKISVTDIYLLETYLKQMRAWYLNQRGNFREDEQ